MSPSVPPSSHLLQAYRSSLKDFQKANNARASGETALTVLLFSVLWAAMVFLYQWSIFLSLLLTIPTAGFLVRLFMVQHDCGHGAMFSSRKVNDWVGRILGVVTLTPYDFWRSSHAIHHASSGHLDKRGIGDVTLLTLREYKSLPPLKQLAYRLYRHPAVMFALGPAWLFLLQHRLPVGAMRGGVMPWASTMLTNIGIACVALLLVWIFGAATVLAVHLPVVLVAATIGVWMFYVQHQFEQTSWESEENWSHPVSAIHGSSFYDLPQPLMWITGNIGIHHLHHLNSRIPFYQLRTALQAHPELKETSRLTFFRSLKGVTLALWDEDAQRLIPFGGCNRSQNERPAIRSHE